nr:MAG TPA: hypothetical protein [Caudoviricetes sp.]
MAIKDNSNPQPQNQGTQPGFSAQPQQSADQNALQNALNQAQAQAQPQSTGYQQHTDGTFSWTSVGSLNPYPVNASPTSVSLTQFEKALKEFWDENISPSVKISTLAVDKGTETNLAVSVLLIIVRPNDSETAPVAYHAFLLESSMEGGIPPRMVNIGGRQVEVLQLVSDTYDQAMMNVLAKVVQSRFPKAEKWYSADAEVIPRHFDLTREDNLRNITVNAIAACGQQLTIASPVFCDLNVARARRDATLTQTTQFGTATELDQSGLPVRSDIIMTTIATSNQNQNNILNIPLQSITTRATGYIDLLINDVSGFLTGNINPYFQAQQYGGQTPVLQANLILTQLVNAQLQTLPGTLLALVNATAIREDDRWLYGLMPPAGVKDNMHDIGYLGYDIPLMTNQQGQPEFGKFPTTPDKFDINQLFALYKRFFHPGIAISLDIPECGALTWQYKIIASAAVGRPEAMQMLRNAAMTLTNGNFDKYYQQAHGTGQFVFANNDSIFLGTYQSKDGIRDIRDFDYLAICGLGGKKDRREIVSWTDTFNGVGPLEDRLNQRRTILGSYLRDVNYTGRALRVNFENAFINALVQGVAECGYHVTPQMPYMENINYQRANAGYITGAVLQSQASGIFRNVGNTYQGNMAFGGRFNHVF